MKLALRILGLTAAAALLGALPAAAQKTVNVTSIHGMDSPQAQVWVRFQEVLDKEIPGKVKINIIAGGVVGGEREEAEQIRLGSIQGSLSTLANLSAWVPEGQLFDVPFMFRGEDHINRVMSGPIGDDMKAKYQAKGFRVLGFITYGARNLLSKKEVKAPADVKGLRMRVIQSPLHIELWKSLGTNPTAVPITEAYNALQTGVVDMMDFTKSGYAQMKLYEVTPYFVNTDHIWALGVMYFGEPFWQSLPADEKAAFQKAADASIPHFNALAKQDHEKSIAEATAKGAKLVTVDQSAWQKAMEPFWATFAPKVGGMERIQAVVNTK
ncbi:MAG: TRAP transporter substrate-binding protein [Thalassobaculales bacterium]